MERAFVLEGKCEDITSIIQRVLKRTYIAPEIVHVVTDFGDLEPFDFHVADAHVFVNPKNAEEVDFVIAIAEKNIPKEYGPLVSVPGVVGLLVAPRDLIYKNIHMVATGFAEPL